MQASWSNRNVDFGLLVSKIKAFFEIRGLVVEERQEASQVFVFARIKRSNKMIEVKVSGSVAEFVVEGMFGEDIDRAPKQIIPSIFGGGAFFLNELRWRETLLKLQQEFFVYLENAVVALTGSSVGGVSQNASGT